MESDETPEQALAREMGKELNMSISVDRLLLTVEPMYPDFKIIMHSFICYTQSRAFHDLVPSHEWQRISTKRIYKIG